MSGHNRKLDLVSPAIILMGLLALLSLVFNWGFPYRQLITIVFLLTCPGGAYVRVLQIRNAIASLILSVAFSLVLDTCIALAMVYLQTWSLFWSLLALYYISLIGVLLKLRSVRAGP